MKSHDINLDSDYVNWIHDVKQRYISTQIKAAVKVNTERLYFNWQLGRDLVERKAEEKWGKGIVEQLSLDLQNEFSAIFGFVPWRHHVEIVTKCKTIEESWSRSTLVDCIKANLL